MSKKTKRIVAAGHVCLDITPGFMNNPVKRIGDLLKPGTLIETSMADVHIGGSIANTGIGLKILGGDVVLMGKIGKDAFGTIVKKQIAEYVSTDSMIEAEGENTSYSVVIAPKGDRQDVPPLPGCQLAVAEGATCVETNDAISGLRTLEELKRRIDAGWEKQ